MGYGSRDRPVAPTGDGNDGRFSHPGLGYRVHTFHFGTSKQSTLSVMAGLVPAIHVGKLRAFVSREFGLGPTWDPGTSPGMTVKERHLIEIA